VNFQTKIAEPKDAAAVVLLNEKGEICWARRSATLAFLPNFHAFPGGKADKSDSETRVENCADDSEKKKLMACAARELFEEVGVLLVRNGEKLTTGQIASLHDDLISGRMNFAEILEHWGLWLDARDFAFVGTWTTPAFSPVRFRTRFFLAFCPSKQLPYPAIGELEDVEFIAPQVALEKWRRGQILCAPPILNTLRVFAEIEPQRHQDAEKTEKASLATFEEKSFIEIREKLLRLSASLRLCGEKLVEIAKQEGENPRKMELNPYITLFPLRTKTLPPATHTNCFIVGHKEFIVIDAASTELEEQNALHQFIVQKIKNGGNCREIIVSHLHPDHFGGEIALQKFLQTEFGLKIPISAHQITAESLDGKTVVQKFIADGEIFELQDENGESFELRTLFAPGHARGHLNFYVENIGFLISCDNVVGTGTVVIAPPEGNLQEYLNSLERLKNLPNLRSLCGSHGPAIADAKSKIEEYIAHRLERERQILKALKDGAKTPSEIVEKVYAGLNPNLIRLAEKSVEAHLEKLQTEGKI
jgi:glyoxylase-like metal-dependent hydrolase (beta-lactamase superfamily II)/8-oxo-dGTP pyrophosphatase MutT (NUDIX family)